MVRVPARARPEASAMPIIKVKAFFIMSSFCPSYSDVYIYHIFAFLSQKNAKTDPL